MDDTNWYTIEFVLKNNLNELNRLSLRLKQISDGFRLNKIDHHDINLVLEEWFTNLIRYGYQDSKESEIRVKIKISDIKLYISVTDEGIYFDPRDFKLPDLQQPLDRRVPGGVGLHLIFKLMDKVSYKKEKDRNLLRLEKDRTKK